MAGAVFLAILFRTTTAPLMPAAFQQWDVLLPFIVYFGQRRTLPEGLILALFTSHLYSLSSSAPIGVFTSHYLIVFLLARLTSYVIYASTWFSTLLVVFSLSFLGRLVLTAVAAFFGHGWPLFSWANFPFWGIVLSAWLGFFVFLMLEGLDRATYKAAKSSIELSEGSL